jgi:hypothetical protein
MTYPAFDTNGLTGADTPGGPVTCTSCGCRLERGAVNGVHAWYHFSPMAGRDARGCKVGCADNAHDANGRALVESAA